MVKYPVLSQKQKKFVERFKKISYIRNSTITINICVFTLHKHLQRNRETAHNMKLRYVGIQHPLKTMIRTVRPNYEYRSTSKDLVLRCKSYGICTIISETFRNTHTHTSTLRENSIYRCNNSAIRNAVCLENGAASATKMVMRPEGMTRALNIHKTQGLFNNCFFFIDFYIGSRPSGFLFIVKRGLMFLCFDHLLRGIGANSSTLHRNLLHSLPVLFPLPRAPSLRYFSEMSGAELGRYALARACRRK